MPVAEEPFRMLSPTVQKKLPGTVDGDGGGGGNDGGGGGRAGRLCEYQRRKGKCDTGKHL